MTGDWYCVDEVGQVIAKYRGDRPNSDEIPSGTVVYPGVIDERLYFVDGNKKTARPSMNLIAPPSAPINTEFVISGIPEGATIRHLGGTAIMDGSGQIEYICAVPDACKFAFKLFPYLDTEITVEITT